MTTGRPPSRSAPLPLRFARDPLEPPTHAARRRPAGRCTPTRPARGAAAGGRSGCAGAPRWRLREGTRGTRRAVRSSAPSSLANTGRHSIVKLRSTPGTARGLHGQPGGDAASKVVVRTQHVQRVASRNHAEAHARRDGPHRRPPTARHAAPARDGDAPARVHRPEFGGTHRNFGPN